MRSPVWIPVPWMRSFFDSPVGGRRRVRSQPVSPSSRMRRGTTQDIFRRWWRLDRHDSIRSFRCGDGCCHELRCIRRWWRSFNGWRRSSRALQKRRWRRSFGWKNGFFRYFYRRRRLLSNRFRICIRIDFRLYVFIRGFCLFGTTKHAQGKHHEALLQERSTLGRRGHRQRLGHRGKTGFRLALLHGPHFHNRKTKQRVRSPWISGSFEQVNSNVRLL